LTRVAGWLALALPLFLLHGRGIAEGLFIAIGLLFLGHSAMRRDWTWLRRTWVRIAIVWWVWVIVCSVPHGGAEVLQALGAGRFLVLVAALESWVLRDAWVRGWFARLLRWAALYIAVQCAVQFALGKSLFGWPRGADGELTGPYQNPRAGAPLSRLLYPAVLPLLRGWGLLWLPAGVLMVVLIGQRMPLLLTLLGLFVSALFLPRLRGIVLATAILTGLGISALPVVSPPTFNRLVTKFSGQMENFERSHYGLIARRAANIVEANPALGVGFDGFRRECENPTYFHGIDLEGGGAAMCVQHPHNFFLQAAVEGGLPGLVLFAALCGAWLVRLGRGLWTDPAPLRVGLFVAALIHLWPIASTTAFTSMPQSGWFFALLGLGLAETQHYITCLTAREMPDV
jgi:O-antigen ligase